MSYQKSDPLTVRSLGILLAATITAFPVQAQSQPADQAAQYSDDGARRARVALGAQVGPKLPGSDEAGIRPYFDLSRARGDNPFKFKAPDQGFGLTLLRAGKLEVGPSLGLEGKRSRKDVDADLPKIGWSVEVGAFAQVYVSDEFRLRSELRKGVTGHKGWVGLLSADYIRRDADQWLISIGPRMTVGNRRHQDTYFGVEPEDELVTGLDPYEANAGIQSVGAAGSLLYQLNPRWGIMSFAKYDRLVGDAARSPIVRELGSRNQLSGGLALSYTFVKRK